MKGIWGLLCLIVTLAIVALVVKQQIGGATKALAQPASATKNGAVQADSVKIQSQQIQQQVRQAMEAAMNQRRPSEQDSEAGN